jgi:AraC-like DNA-binding protein
MVQKKYVIILLLLANCAQAQLSNNSRFDSLSGKSFEYLKEGFEASLYDRIKSKTYVLAWLQKAKAEKNNYVQLALAYKASIINADTSMRLFYADSMITNAERANSDELVGSCYLTKGIVHYNRMEHIKALDNYLIADRYISRLNNPMLVYKIKYEIAKIKYYLGFYDEAISLLRECVTFFEEESDRGYLNSLHLLGLCYTQIGKYELASETNQLGIDEGHLFEDTSMEFYFNHSEGINQCYQKDYRGAIKKLNSALPDVIDLNDHANASTAYFYIGKSYWSLKKTNEAIVYFKKVDRIFQKEKCMLPNLRKAYEYLIDYYKEKGELQSELFYINQLLAVDKILSQDYKYLLKKIVKEYDTKELINAKNAIENTVVFTRIAACAIVVVMAMVICHLIRRNRRNLKLFEELMKRDTSNQPLPADIQFEEIDIDSCDIELAKQYPDVIETDSISKQNSRRITPEIEDAIVKRLEKFEFNKKYLEKDMTVGKMATILQTNPKYVTKVIAKHRGQGTIEYITELKLNYIVEMLKTDSKYRNYTNKALGDEAGFRTTQNFTRSFKSHTGITPTYFSYQLKKSINTDSSV